MSVSVRNPPQRRRSLGPVSPKRIYRNLSVRLRGGESSVGGETDALKHLGKSADAVRYLDVILRGGLVIETEIMRSFFGGTRWLCVTVNVLSQAKLLLRFMVWFTCPAFLSHPMHFLAQHLSFIYLIKIVWKIVWTLFLCLSPNPTTTPDPDPWSLVPISTRPCGRQWKMRTLWLYKACCPETTPTVEEEQEEQACGREERRKRRTGSERGRGGWTGWATRAWSPWM